MSKNLYLYNKDLDQLQITSTDQMVYVPEEDVKKIENEHRNDLENRYGRLKLDNNNKLIYEDYMVNVLVHKEMYYYTETNVVPEGNDPTFDVIQVKKSVFMKYEELRQDSLNGTRTVLYYDNDFHEINIPEGMIFDYKTKKVVKDIQREIQGLLFRLDRYNLENEIKYNGFPFEINGKTYLQPFRGTEDRSYYSTLKNDVNPDLREVKFFKDNGDGVRNSADFDLIVGPSLSDLFLEGMILKIIKYENAVKPVLEEYWNEIQDAADKKNVEKLTKLYENRQKEIIRRIEDYIK